MRKTKYGVYGFKNLITGHLYFGSGVIVKRLRWHTRALERGAHPVLHWQRAWEKYGADAFTNFVLDYCEKQDCKYLEKLWVDEFETRNPLKGYNILDPVEGWKGIPRPEHSKAIKGRKNTPEHNAKNSAAQKGKPKSLEHIENIRKSRVGMKPTTKQLEALDRGRKIGSAMSPSEETRKKQSRYMKSLPMTEKRLWDLTKSVSRNYIVVDPQGQEYKVFNLAEFCRKYGLSRTAMGNVISGRSKTHKGWKYERTSMRDTCR